MGEGGGDQTDVLKLRLHITFQMPTLTEFARAHVPLISTTAISCDNMYFPENIKTQKTGAHHLEVGGATLHQTSGPAVQGADVCSLLWGSATSKCRVNRRE